MSRSSIILLSLSICLIGNAAAVEAGQGRGGAKSLHVAARQGDLEALKAQIAKGANLNQADRFGYTPLVCALEANGMEAFKLLLDAGADANVKDGTGAPPLVAAASRGQLQMVQLLLAKGADVKATDRQDATALHAAVRTSQQPVVEALVEAGADVNALDKRRQTPLTLAQRTQRAAIIEYLQQHGATEPAAIDTRLGPYGDRYEEMTLQQLGPTAARPGAPAPALPAVNVLDDPNALREKLKAFPGLEASLQGIDANSLTAQRSWIQRRIDNRTSLIRVVEKQFGTELTFLKGIAKEEKAEKTITAIDALAAQRKNRYAGVGDALREQRREALRSEATAGRGRGRYAGRGGRGASTGTMTDSRADPYANTGPTAARRTGRQGPTEPPVDAVTQGQIQDWLQAKPEDKQRLLDSVLELDLGELEGLRLVAEQEEAKKTTAAAEGLMLARHDRAAKIQQKWVEEDERTQRMQERNEQRGTIRGRGRGMQNTQGQNNQNTQRPGRRYR